MLIRNENNGMPGIYEDDDHAENVEAPLSDLLEFTSSEEKWRTTFITFNCGNPAFGISMSAKEFYENSRIANDSKQGDVAQRQLNASHAKGLGTYLFKGLVNAAIGFSRAKGEEPLDALFEIQELIGKSVYVGIQPIVCNIRDTKGVKAFNGYRVADPKGPETVCFRTAFLPKHLMYVIDGQHRREGFRYVFDFLKSVESTGKIGKQANLIPSTDVVGDVSEEWLRAFKAIDRAASAYATVLIEAHLGLSTEEERQLFSDLNSKGLNVSANLTLAFDGSNPVNEYVKQATKSRLISMPIIETEKNAEISIQDGAILRKDIVAMNAQLFVNSGSIKSATSQKVELRRDTADRFWTAVGKIPGIGKPGLDKRSILSQSVVLKAMAKLCYALTPKKESDSPAALDKYLLAIPTIDFSHENTAWILNSAISKIEEGSTQPTIADYTAYNTSKTAQRGIGSYDSENSRFTFSTRANDVMPVLGDILRFEIGLPNRHIKK